MPGAPAVTLIVGLGRASSGAGTLALDPDESHYLRRVLRLPAGSPVRLLDGAGGAWDGILRGQAVAYGPRQDLPRPTGAAIRIGFSPPKGRRLDVLLEKATELGAASLHPVVCERTVRRPAEPVERWRRILLGAGRQCGSAWLPEIHAPVPLAGFLEVAAAVRLVALPGAPPLSAALPAVAPSTIAALTGPEGGFTSAEESALRAAGFSAVGLGPRVLRAETAPLVLLAVLGFRFGDLDA